MNRSITIPAWIIAVVMAILCQTTWANEPGPSCKPAKKSGSAWCNCIYSTAYGWVCVNYCESWTSGDCSGPNSPNGCCGATYAHYYLCAHAEGTWDHPPTCYNTTECVDVWDCISC